ncbi:VWA domain-containing protein [Spirochaetia bacterium 38H-sp]|uniref:VWA domain-containing protein n=1 Tax=Rarispira pelagica TaxID=3141764 RepID=A0ABU9U9M6_9SPIR
MKNRYIAVICFILFSSLFVFSQDLSVKPDELIIEQALEGGYHLWIKKKPDIASVLITESTEDPARKVASYALRTTSYNKINGEEKRLLNGEFLDNSRGYYLIDSSAEKHPILGEAFHIFIPYVVVYGYPWTRHGEMQILDGSYLNIRTFVRPYADYSGGFKDNPFILRVVQKPFTGPPEANYMPQAEESFKKLSQRSKTPLFYSTGHEDVLSQIKKVLEDKKGDSLDLVLVLDTTQSMEDDIPFLQKQLVSIIRNTCKGYKKIRVGVVLYKDYMEEYLNKVIPFQSDLDRFNSLISTIRVSGGRDLPEAVYEALYAALIRFDWLYDDRKIILIGDAPPHPFPRGSVTEDMVYSAAEKKHVLVFPILLPQ